MNPGAYSASHLNEVQIYLELRSPALQRLMRWRFSPACGDAPLREPPCMAMAQSARFAMASDFACILTVTHMPHLKEAFQARIEVSKTQQGSQVHLLI